MTLCRVAVIGAGVTGLTAAYRLLQRGYHVRVLEAGEAPGGLLRTFEVGGESLECFYHHAFTSDTALIGLIDELGLSHTMAWQPSRVGVFHDGCLFPFSTAIDLLRFSPVPPLDRLRLGLMAMRLRREGDGSRFDGIAASEWVRRNAGQRALDVVWQPLLRGKFGEMAGAVAMTWLWNKVHLRFASRAGGLFGGETLGYPTGSFAVWIDALVGRILELGGEVQTGRAVELIEARGDGFVVDPGGSEEEFDAVVATVASQRFLDMAPDLPESYSAPLRAIRYQDALCVSLVLKRPLTSFYWLNMSDESVPFVAIVEHTNLVGSDRYGGRHIVYVSNYVSPQSSLVAKSVDELFDLYEPHLRRINPAFDRSWVIERRLHHGRDAQPVFAVGAERRIAPHRTPVPGLYLANMAQIYPQDRGQNFAILMGDRVATMVASDLGREKAKAYQV